MTGNKKHNNHRGSSKKIGHAEWRLELTSHITIHTIFWTADLWMWLGSQKYMFSMQESPTTVCYGMLSIGKDDFHLQQQHKTACAVLRADCKILDYLRLTHTMQHCVQYCMQSIFSDVDTCCNITRNIWPSRFATLTQNCEQRLWLTSFSLQRYNVKHNVAGSSYMVRLLVAMLPKLSSLLLLQHCLQYCAQQF